jgi:hypothetical protein
MPNTAFDHWHDYIKSYDPLHPDAVFESPIMHTPQRGRELTFKYLASAKKVLGSLGFKYVGDWRSDYGAVRF